MAVLIEAFSVIVRVDAILSKVQGGWNAFQDLVPNSTLAADGEIARVGFMNYDDVMQFVAILEHAGLIHLRDRGWIAAILVRLLQSTRSKAEDLVVVDQQQGPMESCDWIEFASVPTDGNQKMVKACRLKGSPGQQVHTPDGWKWEGSMSSSPSLLYRRVDDSSSQVTEISDGIDEIRTPLSPEPWYIGRPFRKKH
jgi:hypothetical protein